MKLMFGILLAIGLGPQIAQAEATFGSIEFMNSCAQCHGADGAGGGPMAGFLTTSTPDLTQLQKNNGGVFPVTATYAVIDGTVQIGGHGSADMPAWGHRYSYDAVDQLGMDFGVSREVYVRTRILALIEYLASIQSD